MLSIKNLYFNYPNSKPVLQSIDLDFKVGNIYGLFGKNGEGKSTLMKLMSGLLFPTHGFCSINGKNMALRSVSGLQHIFLVPEDFELPALQIAIFEQINSSFYPNFSKDRFYGLIDEFQLSTKDKISKLSFGQKKKVLIAFGIATNTPLLLMDEPTNGLDIPSKSQFRKVMAAAVDEGKCVVISTHQVRDLHSLINHVTILDNAKVVFDHPLEVVSDKLWFGRPSTSDADAGIYSETSFGGKTIIERQDRDESEMDLELLFNGVLHASPKIKNIFQNTNHEA
ncbi:MAG: ABC transporter ATP-binding protein [Bacteroidota bacterium]